MPAGCCALCYQELKTDGHDCARSENLAWVLSWGLYTNPLRQAVHRLKYKRDVSLGENLSQYLAGLLDAEKIGEVIVMPVPLWPGRQRQRGYNQAALLARPLAHALGLPYMHKAVARIRNTPSQVGLNIKKRHENVEGAFRADPKLVAGKRVLLVDDVLTTGATLDSAAQALRQAGVQEVMAVVLARAMGQPLQEPTKQMEPKSV